MTLAEFRKDDTHLRARLANARPARFIAIEVPRFAAAMALALVALDTLPWDVSLWNGQPVKRLLFILTWALAMAFWQRARVTRLANERSVQAGIGAVSS